MALADLELFAGASAADVAVVEAAMTPVQVATGEALMREGEHGSNFVLIVDGEADVQRQGVTVGEAGPGSIVGELALLRGRPRAATVVARTPLRGLCGDATAFATLAAVPGVRERFGRTAGQRLIASALPVRTTLGATPIEIRPIAPADRRRFEEALDKHFSLESHRKRFFSPGRPSAAMLSYLVDVDYVDHFAWVVLAEEDGEQRGIASARFIRLHDDPDTAEIAFGVTDDYQGRGLGKLLLGALAVAAPIAGVRRFRASVLAENAPMRALLDRAGARWTFDEPGVVGTTFDVAAVTGLLDSDLAAALAISAREIVAAASLALA